MTTLRSNLHLSMLATRAEMEANHAKHLVYARAAPSDAHTKALAMFYEEMRAAAAVRCDELQAKMESVPF